MAWKLIPIGWALFAFHPGRAGAAIPGLSGTQGNDLTLEYLYTLRNFQALPDWPIVYVSADDNAGCVPTIYGKCLPQARRLRR